MLDSEALTGLVRLSLGLKTSDRTPIPDGPKGPYPTEQRFARMLKIRRGCLQCISRIGEHNRVK